MNTPLSTTSDKNCLEIRLESIGGLGANLCGKLLGELGALYLNLNSSNFSSYGSEKRGSPVKAYIRWCPPNNELRINSPIEHPDILAIFHEGLLGKCPVLNGITSNTKIILNTSCSTKEAAKKYNISTGQLFCMDANEAAYETKSRVNMIFLGAIARAANLVPLESVNRLCHDTLGKKYPAQLDNNLAGLQLGYTLIDSSLCLDFSENSSCKENSDSATSKDNRSNEKFQPENSAPYNQYTWGYDNAPIGGVNPRIGSTVSNDLSPSREGFIPLFLPEKCITCGLCDSTCPDLVFQFYLKDPSDKKTLVNGGLDYYHCKGCLRCVDVCPTAALVAVKETDYPDKPWFVPNKDLIPDSIQYEETAENSWITSDSYLTERSLQDH